ncbi:MAG TPA: hypothetical protein VH370_03945 [Humisphaera sp.]|jgi:hypothetical protein|nr:hypothetical protein [Humisphaera sp.]
MKRLWRISWNGASAASAVLCLIIAVSLFENYNHHDVSYEFMHHGMRWELACRSARFWLDNEPQRREETALFVARTTDLQQGVHEAWGTAGWHKRADELHRLEQEQAMIATPAIGHSLAALPILAITAILPAFWILSRASLRGIFGYRGLARISAVLCVTSIVIWLASFRYYASFRHAGLQKNLAYCQERRIRVTLGGGAVQIEDDVQRAPAPPPGPPAALVPLLTTNRNARAMLRNRRDVELGTFLRFSERMADDVDDVRKHPFLDVGRKSSEHVPAELPTRLGFGYHYDGHPTPLVPSHRWAVRLPLWAPAGMALLVTVVFRRRASRRWNAGCCANCGYDLTGNISGVCPECGTVPASTPKGPK